MTLLRPAPAGFALLLAGQLVFTARNALGGDLPYAALLLSGAAGYGLVARAIGGLPDRSAIEGLALGLGVCAVSTLLRAAWNLGDLASAWNVPLLLLTLGSIAAAWHAYSWSGAPKAAAARSAAGLRLGFGLMALAHVAYLGLHVAGGDYAQIPDVGLAFATSAAGAGLAAWHMGDEGVALEPSGTPS